MRKLMHKMCVITFICIMAIFIFCSTKTYGFEFSWFDEENSYKAIAISDNEGMAIMEGEDNYYSLPHMPLGDWKAVLQKCAYENEYYEYEGNQDGTLIAIKVKISRTEVSSAKYKLGDTNYYWQTNADSVNYTEERKKENQESWDLYLEIEFLHDEEGKYYPKANRAIPTEWLTRDDEGNVVEEENNNYNPEEDSWPRTKNY